MSELIYELSPEQLEIRGAIERIMADRKKHMPRILADPERR